ncbi:Uncharacterised protein [Plesiomonas shigelloides]|uniref:hypothetical protein n=1 Tax=Plesiomonas shigelloides TaxID=703 RepID=UPI000DF9D713|nr:hypothetical protein [Plesiomonas shigelloides]SUC49252.1 Uncharacterised protein [Plesiomonas shigelloides]SUC49255.1 Uncharacterised protein [Plesiomonas shigelloides]
MKEIEELCEALKKKRFKSKQTTFNHYYENFCAAKNLYGWERVTRFINSETGENLAISTYKCMYERTKKAQKKIKNESEVVAKNSFLTQATKTQAIKGFFSQKEKERKPEHDASATMAKFEEKYR